MNLWKPRCRTRCRRAFSSSPTGRADPTAVVNALTRWAEPRSASFELLVPAWLHGLDWAGERALCATSADRIAESAEAAGLPFEAAEVGDHDVVAAIMDVVLSRPVDQLLVCVCERHQHMHPFDLFHRASRATGLPVNRVVVPDGATAGPRRARHWPGASHCPPSEGLAPAPGG